MKTTRREFLVSSAAGAALTPLFAASPALAPTAPAAAVSGAATQRERLRARNRNLFNGDTCTFFYNPEMWQPDEFSMKSGQGKTGTQTLPVGGPFTAKAIHRYVETLKRSGIDTFVINANASRAWYPSKTTPTILEGYRRGDREYFRGHAICAGVTEPEQIEGFLDRFESFFGLYQDLLDAGVDWLAETAKACRIQELSPWVSIRMNDFHGAKNIDGSFFNHPLLKRPEMRLKRGAYSPTMRDPSYRTGLNFARREVRDALLAQIKEVVEDYDYEGLELDWWRNPMCCEPNAAPETVAMISAWIREIRGLTEAQARRTGRSYPLGMRIPGQIDTLKSIGLDIEALCRDGTLDCIGPSGFWCTSWEMPHDDLRRRLGESVMIYGVVEVGANNLPSRSPERDLTQRIRFISSSREILRANAAGKLALGADGIEWFNFFCADQARLPGVISDYDALRGLHNLEALRGTAKHYSFSMFGNALTHIPFEITPQLPVVLNAGWYHPFRLPMCAEPKDRSLELVVQVVLKAGETFKALPVSFNGSWPVLEHQRTDRLLFPCGLLSHHVPENIGYNIRFPVSLIREGWNEIVIENGGSSALTVVCLELAVRTAVEA